MTDHAQSTSPRPRRAPSAEALRVAVAEGNRLANRNWFTRTLDRLVRWRLERNFRLAQRQEERR